MPQWRMSRPTTRSSSRRFAPLLSAALCAPSEHLLMSAVAERVLPRRRLPGLASRLRLRPYVSSRPRTYLEVEVAMVIVALAAWLLVGLHAAEAQLQTGKVWRIGVLTALYPPDADASQAFRQRLRTLGYVEGQNLVIEWRYTQSRDDRPPGVAAETVRRTGAL